MNGQVKATSTNFPAFKAIGDYNPGVPLTGALAGKKWYMPASGEWKYAYPLGCCEQPITTSSWYKWYGRLADIAFTQVGGTELVGNNGKWYWASTEYGASHASGMAFRNHGLTIGFGDKNVDQFSRAFIKY